MTDLAARVRRFVARRRLWGPGARVVAALSGGSDSVAQLWLLHDLAAAGVLTLAGAAHLNHALRATADRDEAFCRALCARLGVPFVGERIDVAAEATATRASIEVAARRVRYAFLERARLACAADRIAVAHTLDDQAETVLLRLLRGAGPHGLRGVPARRGAVVRPLLGCTRDELRAALAARGEPWVDDETNADVSMPRNRVRHELLPLLVARFQPAVARVLARTAEVAAAEDAYLEALAGDLAIRAVRPGPRGVALVLPALLEAPVALQRRVVRRALAAAGGRRAPDLADVDRVLDVCAPDGPRATESCGVRVERFSPGTVLLGKGVAALAPEPLAERRLTVPGVVELPEVGPGCRVRAHRPIEEGTAFAASPRCAVLRTDVAAPLVVRGRRAGDRVQPVGLGGTKKVQDLLVDRKVPAGQRGQVPVVTDASGKVVWVVGHAVAADAVAASGADDVIVLTFEQPGAPGSEGT